MTRLGVLRLGYGAIGASFAALALSTFVGALLFLGLALAFVGGVLLAFSDDDLPKWAGIALLGYFLFCVVAFLAATPITIDRGDGYFVNKAPPELANKVMEYLVLLSPLMLGATAAAAAWEREHAPRLLLFGAVAGFVVVAILSLLLVPEVAAGNAEEVAEEVANAASSARAQGDMLRTLFSVSAAAGAAGAIWAAGRPDEVA